MYCRSDCGELIEENWCKNIVDTLKKDKSLSKFTTDI